MKLTNKRIYLDFNSTSPLAKKVSDFLSKGDFFLANPSSAHSSGKETLKKINQVRDFLYQYFSVKPESYNILFHSGVTEALNLFLRQTHYDAACFTTDHPTALKIVKEQKGSILAPLNGKAVKLKKCILNSSWVNNETGRVEDIKQLIELKKSNPELLLHIDAAQVVGKIMGDNKLEPEVDIYTFSGHKFGGMPGVGFSFIKKDLDFKPTQIGSKLEEGLRAGTLNTLGIMSLKLALEDLRDNLKQKEMLEFQQEIKSLIKGNKSLELIESTHQANNTCCFYHKEKNANLSLVQFDLNGIDISSGSACSSGSNLPSSSMVALGLEEYALNNLRISFGYQSLNDRTEILERLKKVLSVL